jgi:hypothetical protein
MVNDLKMVAANADKSVKKFMEDLVLHEVRMQIQKIKKN